MSAAPRKSRFIPWAKRLGIAIIGAFLLMAAAFWKWPLHFQAHVPFVGELLSERPINWDAVEEDPSGRSPRVQLQTQDYFPERTFRPAHDGTSFEEISLAEELQTYRETSLYSRRTNPSAHVYRLLWRRSFDPVIIVRLEVEPDGTARLFSKHFALRPVRAKLTQSEKKLSRGSTLKLISQFEQSGFWNAPAEEAEDGGFDGATWFLEGCRDGRYHVIQRWSPKNGNPFKSLGLDLLEAAGFWRGPIY